jgi:hypothetical protein
VQKAGSGVTPYDPACWRAHNTVYADTHGDVTSCFGRYASDLSGHSIADESVGWLNPALPLPPTLLALLELIGGYYTPFLLANERAVAAGELSFVTTLQGGVKWEQPSFKYQAKCLKWLREEWQALSGLDRRWMQDQLRSTGILPLFETAPHPSPKL